MSGRVPKLLTTMGLVLALSASLGAGSVLAVSPLPSGEVTFGQTVVEPAYDDGTGTLVYLSTPMHVGVHPVFARNVAPLYLPVYPVGVNVGTLNCQDTTATTVENCPDHGPEVAGAAMGISAAMGFGDVYANGVQGHDHLVGIASSGGDFNILWEPVLVLFTNTGAASSHLTTLDQINAALTGPNPDAIAFPLPSATFNCAVVPAAVYARGTPYQL